MGGCGLCRPKVTSSKKRNPDFSTKKVDRIDTWIENIEGPYEPIILPTHPPDQPKVISNQDEITETQRNDHSNNFITRSNRTEKVNVQYLSPGISINEEI
ncbi:hypothetical protein I4U23_002402 [Adineta vaga]|nr:hypothetical protein I4U23_002402 [Adineta vaga]